MSRSLFAFSAVFAMFVASAPAFADILFTDSTFANSNYTQVGPFQSGATITGSQCTSCGNPGFALQVVENFSVTGGSAALGFVNNTFSYNPSTQGAIVSIDVASVSKDATISNAGTGTAGNTFRPLIEQDGNYYLAAIAGANFPYSGTTTTTGFVTLSQSGLVAADFLQYNFSTGASGTATPNFAGDAMLFGLAQISSGFPSGASVEQDYDNLSLSISNTPEPSSVCLLVSLVLLLGLTLRHRQFNLR
jgi:hypothetical protein